MIIETLDDSIAKKTNCHCLKSTDNKKCIVMGSHGHNGAKFNWLLSAIFERKYLFDK